MAQSTGQTSCPTHVHTTYTYCTLISMWALVCCSLHPPRSYVSVPVLRRPSIGRRRAFL